VTKYLVYNTRKRQEGGDSAERYFSCTEQVAGVQDTRFQALMPDPLHFLGVTKIHNFISMSDMKYNAIVATGIKIVNRIEIPPEMVPVRVYISIPSLPLSLSLVGILPSRRLAVLTQMSFFSFLV
jgi:GTP cyclohydrolase II